MLPFRLNATRLQNKVVVRVGISVRRYCQQFITLNTMDDDFEGFDGGDDVLLDDVNALEEEFPDVGEETNDKLRLQAASHYFIGKICDNEGNARESNAQICHKCDILITLILFFGSPFYYCLISIYYVHTYLNKIFVIL